jgi:flagellar M-ring protein FliF
MAAALHSELRCMADTFGCECAPVLSLAKEIMLDGPKSFGQALQQASDELRGLTLSRRAGFAAGALIAGAAFWLFAADTAGNAPPPHRTAANESTVFDLDEKLARSVVRTLEPVVGPDRVQATVHVEYDTSATEDTQEIYDPKNMATVSQQRSIENAGVGQGGLPGPSGKIPATAVPVTPTQSSSPESSTLLVNKSVRRIIQAPGRISRITAAIVVDDALQPIEKDGRQITSRRRRTTEELKQIEQLAGAAIGLKISRGDLLTVRNFPFLDTMAEIPPAVGVLGKIRQTTTQGSGLLHYFEVAALFFIVDFLLLLPIKKQMLIALRELSLSGGQQKAFAEGPAVAAAEIESQSGTEQSRRTAALKQKLVAQMKKEPAAASLVVQNWLREGKE